MSYKNAGISTKDVANSVHKGILCLHNKDVDLADWLDADLNECTDGFVLSRFGAFLNYHDNVPRIWEYEKRTGRETQWFIEHPFLETN
jgi:hypothetical protein